MEITMQSYDRIWCKTVTKYDTYTHAYTCAPKAYGVSFLHYNQIIIKFLNIRNYDTQNLGLIVMQKPIRFKAHNMRKDKMVLYYQRC